ncbi:integrase arm-type DNA-binding domain-containing protein [Ramlibacter sp. G-1-2-2]|uniref:Integrase arm-type DNA-binding domain-containing protein n=1 Tax=Ramlibacter agri TaxID=2728837 RepID=A0A848H1R6_9BURK|nr:site-specific integrase [Ramlibacter agri]NML43521.1 integrase arm-type DNA-binding domain-containing protein [Ramlibacter agri]
MARKAQELSALVVGRLKEPGMHAVGGVSGLYLQVLDSGARTWVLRASIAGRRRDMGLGGFPDVTLALARDKARQARALIDQGVDPIEARREQRSALKASTAAARSFKECATAYIEAKAPEWRNPKHEQQWTNTLEQYAYPVVGDMLVRDVELAQIMRVLEPIWRKKTETAKRLRGRLEAVLDWAAVRGYRSRENPARWRGHLDKLLPAPNKVANREHHEAMPIDDAAAFMVELRAKPGLGARALELAILTAARSGEVRGARWPEFDLQAASWTVPKERMKAAKEHRVPLSPAAVKLLRALPRVDGADLLFPSRKNTMLSDMTLTKVMRDMDLEAVPHGFRSTFRDWASERTNYAREVAEMALAHTIGDKVEAAYRRGELFDKRRQMMNDWAAFLAKPLPAGGKVVPMKAKRAT